MEQKILFIRPQLLARRGDPRHVTGLKLVPQRDQVRENVRSGPCVRNQTANSVPSGVLARNSRRDEVSLADFALGNVSISAKRNGSDFSSRIGHNAERRRVGARAAEEI